MIAPGQGFTFSLQVEIYNRDGIFSVEVKSWASGSGSVLVVAHYDPAAIIEFIERHGGSSLAREVAKKLNETVRL